jgi:glycosyltransferase involved in cell wall biosynthesis
MAIKKRVLFLSHYGANEQFQDFFAEVANKNYEVKAIIPKEVIYRNGYRPQYFPARKTINDVEYIPSKLFDKTRYHLSGYFPELPKTIVHFKPDIIIVTDEVYTIDAWFVILYKILFFKKYQIISWSQAHYMENSRVIRPLGRCLFWWNRKFIHKFVARNKSQENRTKKTLKNNEFVQHVYWGTNSTVFQKLNLDKKILQSKLDICVDLENKKVISFVGRIVPEKGIMNVIKALKQLPADVIFLILGQGNDKFIQEIRNYIQNNSLTNRCFLIKDKKNNDLVYFYNLTDLLILPTTNINNYYELFGRVLPEAMMCKTLVLGSSNGAIPEVINNKQCLFEQNNQSEMEEKIKKLLYQSTEEKNKIIDENYKYAMAKFTNSAFADNLSSLIEK